MVIGLLQRPGRFTESVQSDHAAAAFQGVRCSPDVGQGLALAGVAAQYPGLLAQAEQYVVAFLEKNRQQFVVNGRCRRRRAGQGRRRERGGGGFALNAAAEGVEIGFALRQSVDEETDQRQTFGERGELRGIGAGRVEATDVGEAGLDRRRCRQVPEHGQGAGDLANRCLQRCQVGGFARAAEILVEHLFDAGQIVVHFTADLLDEQPFLRSPAHFVECRRFAVIDRNAAGNTGMQAVDHAVDLEREFAIQLLELHLGILEEQDRGGDFHRHCIAVPRRGFDQPGDDRRQSLGQAAQIGIAEFMRK